MKKLIVIFFILQLAACSTKETTPTTVSDDLPPATATTVAEGSFINGAHATSGIAKIVLENGANKLVLENFKTDAGPDLKIYLSNDLNASSFINIGDLKSTNGNLVYAVTGNPDLSTYKYVLVWCEQFAVRFGSAELE